MRSFIFKSIVHSKFDEVCPQGTSGKCTRYGTFHTSSSEFIRAVFCTRDEHKSWSVTNLSNCRPRMGCL